MPEPPILIWKFGHAAPGAGIVCLCEGGVSMDKQIPAGKPHSIALEDRLLVQGRIRIAPHLEKWHEALQMAVWDGSAWEKGEWVRLDDGSYPLDCLDSMEYGLYPLKQWIA